MTYEEVFTGNSPDAVMERESLLLGMRRPSRSLFVDDSPEYYRWYEHGGAARLRPLDANELAQVLVEQRGCSLAEAKDLVFRLSGARDGDADLWRLIQEWEAKAAGMSADADGGKAEKAFCCIHGLDRKSGNGGNFLHRGDFCALSPVYLNVSDLLAWLHDNDWSGVTQTGGELVAYRGVSRQLASREDLRL